MHRSAAPDKIQRRAAARRDGAAVSHQEQGAASRQAEQQGEGHDERGHYGSAAPDSPSDHVKPKRA
jgi:hypothetical protein